MHGKVEHQLYSGSQGQTKAEAKICRMKHIMRCSIQSLAVLLPCRAPKQHKLCLHWCWMQSCIADDAVHSLCHDCCDYQKLCPNFELSLLRGTIAVRMQWLVTNGAVLKSRLSLHQMSLQREVTVQAKGKLISTNICKVEILWCFSGSCDPCLLAVLAGLDAYWLQLEALAHSFLRGVPLDQISTFLQRAVFVSYCGPVDLSSASAMHYTNQGTYSAAEVTIDFLIE